jgi:hypothetical protein
MRSYFRAIFGSLAVTAIVMILILGFHVGGNSLATIGTYSALFGAFVGGTLCLVSVGLPFRQQENAEPWLKREQLAWTLLGSGCIAWGIGECFWRYYVAHGESPFPSLADSGYSCFPPLVFAGLMLQPFSSSGNKRIFLLLDSLIAMGALLSIAWFFLLGALAQSPAQSLLGKFLGLYYPTTDVALLSCIVFLLLRGYSSTYQTRVRRFSLLIVGVGLSIFATSDFLFNVLQNMGAVVDGSWIDLGWPLGMIMMGTGGYLRRILPRSTGSTSEQQKEQRSKGFHFGPTQLVPYLLLLFLFLVLGSNILSSDKTQQSIRPVLLMATLIVIGLVIVRQITTMQENERLIQEQADIFKKLEKVHQDVKKRKIELEEGVSHLKEIQTRLANGDVRARAQIMGGDLWPLAVGLNLMADRMMRSEHNQKHTQNLVRAIDDLSVTLEGRGNRTLPVIPASCLDIPELHRLLTAMGLRAPSGTHLPETSTPSFHHQPLTSPVRPRNSSHFSYNDSAKP